MDDIRKLEDETQHQLNEVKCFFILFCLFDEINLHVSTFFIFIIIVVYGQQKNPTVFFGKGKICINTNNKFA